MYYVVQFDDLSKQVINWYTSEIFSNNQGSIWVDSDTYNQVLISGGYGWMVSNNQIVTPNTYTKLLFDQRNKIGELKGNCAQSIYFGFNTVIKGNNYTITLNEGRNNHDQTNALMASMAAQGAMQKATIWTANTTYYPNSVIVSNATYFMTFSGGISGNTQPVFPSNFSVNVQDGTIQWYKMGFRVSTSNGAILVDPPTAVSLFEQGIVFVNSQREKYGILKSQVLAANTSDAVSLITW